MIPHPRGPVTGLAARKSGVIPTDYFGKRPDVDAGFVMIEHPVPVGEICRPCQGEIAETDRGYLDFSISTGEFKAVHLECDVLLHTGWDSEALRGEAGCPPYDHPSDVSRRDMARAALVYVNHCRARIGLGPL